MILNNYLRTTMKTIQELLTENIGFRWIFTLCNVKKRDRFVMLPISNYISKI